MSIFEFDEEKEWALMRKAEYSVGVEDGIRKGLESGRREHIREVASRMLSAGTYTLEEIVNISGLAMEAVIKLEEELKA